ncbi:Coiled-coil domain-containing protein 13 [Argiope bruennichi]|uniref:Coiled-coil domain-containing protein 13 n=1 Tax=Argiope bruennichi TaxID=94029 RepID=A0A8T0FTK3_ARGBR|nr:Coiled-coil domain-containing protein 13 [Argiope bruennichi]
MPKDVKDAHPRCDACDHQKLKSLENCSAVRELRDKIEQLNFRLTECRTENQMLKRNLHLAKQMVCKEIGEHSENFQTLLKHGTDPGFRGRLETVLLLKKKVHDLQDHLKKLEGEAPKVRETCSEEFVKKRIPEDRKAYWRMELERRLAKEDAEKQMSPVAKECHELRKKLEAEKTRFRDLNSELNLLRAELDSQVNKNEEDMGLVLSFKTMENQLQDTLNERAEIRDALAGYKARNKRLEGEISSLKDELQILYNKAKDNNLLIDSLTGKHKQIQEAIEAEKSIVRQNVERYKDELKQMKDNYESDVKLLDYLQSLTYERNNMVESLKKDIESGLVEEESDKEDAESTEKEDPQPPVETDLSDEPKSTSSQENPPNPDDDQALQDAPEGKKPSMSESKSKILQMTIDCEKYKTLLEAAQMESHRLSYIISIQEKQMNDIAMKVVETGRIIMQKNAEKKELSEKIKRLQKSIAERRKKSSFFMQSKSRLQDLAIKIDALKEENDFLRSFLQTAVESKFDDFDLYRRFVGETKEFFINALKEIRTTLKQKKEPQDEALVEELTEGSDGNE